MSKEDRFWFGRVKYRILKGKDGVREAYDRMAEVYDTSKYLYWTRRMEDAEERVLSRWVDDLSGFCLDIGCGTGRYSLSIAAEGVKVVGLDISLEMLKRLRLKAKRGNIDEKVYVILADGEHIPFRDGVFDSLVCTLAFDHFMNCHRTAKEFSRVLKTGGYYATSVFNSRTVGAFQRKYGFGNRVPFKTESMSPVLIYEVGHSAAEISRIFEKHGFRVENIKGCCYWHMSPLLESYYPQWLDDFFNLFRSMLKHAEIHAILMKKTYACAK